MKAPLLFKEGWTPWADREIKSKTTAIYPISVLSARIDEVIPHYGSSGPPFAI